MSYITNSNLGATSPKDDYQLVADDLALWLENMSTVIADAMKPKGLAPFAVQISDQQKILYYRDQLFNPDGTPNMQGRTAEMTRLGPAGFRMVYKAVVQAFPNLRIPAPPEGQAPTPLMAPPEALTSEENIQSPTGTPGGATPLGRGHR